MSTEIGEIACPQCGTVNTYAVVHAHVEPGGERVADGLGGIDAHADNFCSKCDYPLFWDQVHVSVFSDDEHADGAHRRLPGVGGRDRVRMKACPACAEPNPIVNLHCMRCASMMELPIPIGDPPTEVVEIYEAVHHERGTDWLLVALCVLVALTVAFLVVFAITQA